MRQLAVLLCLTFAVLLAGSLSSVQASDLPKCPSSYNPNTWTNCVGTITHDGHKYVGEFRDGKPHGQATFTFSSSSQFAGDKYVGEYRDGKRTGQGTYTYADGSQYVGEYRDGIRHGQGTYTYADGNKYAGEYRDGEAHGQGVHYYLADNQFKGDKYVGEFRDGKPHGQGTYTTASGNKYVGESRDGKRTGQGTYTYADGSQYVGEYRDNKSHGQGTYTYADGRVLEGVWENGDFQYAKKDPKIEERRKAELEAERRKNQKIVTASTSAGSSGKTVYCKKNDSAVYSYTKISSSSFGCGGNKIITKAEYDRLKGEKTTTADYEERTYCKQKDGTVYSYITASVPTYGSREDSIGYDGCKRLGAQNTPITKAEFDRLSGKEEERREVEREAEKREQERIAKQKREAERREAKRREAEKKEEERREQERIAREQQEAERIARERAALPELDVLDAPYVALKNANVRERPDVKSPRVTTLSVGSEITALGKVRDKNWYLVARDGKELGYVFGTLLGEPEAEPETRVATAPEPKAVKAPENKNAVAVIIGNRNYEGDIPKVDYAHNDADAIRTFVTDLLGHDPDNIIDLRDATQAKLQATFGNERSHQGKLWSYLDAKGGSDVVIYYSGHGVPGQKDQRGYLLPADADPDHPEINGYPLDVLYANLGKLEARSITVLLDACFSGGSHQGMLIRSASPILVSAQEIHEGSGKIVILTAASGDQLASWDEKAKHGLFTRYFLEGAYGAADTDGNRKIELEEIKTYLDRTMTRRARRDFLREQEAWISGAPDTVLVQLGSQQN